MSFENTDERIERLEAIVKSQHEINRRMMDWMSQCGKSQQDTAQRILALVLSLKKEAICTQKFILEQAVFGIQEVKNAWLNHIKKDELILDKMIAGAIEPALKQPAPPLLPPLPPIGGASPTA